MVRWHGTYSEQFYLDHRGLSLLIISSHVLPALVSPSIHHSITASDDVSSGPVLH